MNLPRNSCIRLLSDANTSSGGDFDASSQLAVGEGGNYVRYGINGYKGNDEALMKHLAFAKLCLLKECYEKAEQLLSGNRDVLDKIAAFLIEKETITGKEFMQIYKEVKGMNEQ